MASSVTGRGSDSLSCHGTDGGVSGHVGELGYFPSSCSIHAHVMACRRTRSAPLGCLRRSALLVGMSWTPRSAGVSCPVPVVLSCFCRQSSSLSRGSVGISPLWETRFEVERNPFRSAEFHPAGVVIRQKGRSWLPAIVRFGEALPVGFPLRHPVLFLGILWAEAHNLFADPLVRVGRVRGSIVFGIV